MHYFKRASIIFKVGKYFWNWRIWLDGIQLHVTGVHDPRPHECKCKPVTTATHKMLSNILWLYTQYIFTHSCKQPYCHIIHRQSNIRIHAHTLYSILRISDMFHLREYWSCTPIVNEWHNGLQMNRLPVNSTVNCSLCLLRKLPDVTCAWLI